MLVLVVGWSTFKAIGVSVHPRACGLALSYDGQMWYAGPRAHHVAGYGLVMTASDSSLSYLDLSGARITFTHGGC